MPSEFEFAREHLEQAWLRLSGEDDTSVMSRAAIDLLIEAVARAEWAQSHGAAEVAPGAEGTDGAEHSPRSAAETGGLVSG